MRLCIDARPMQNAHRTRGVGVLLANLLREMGRLAAEVLLGRISNGAGPNSPTSLRVEPELVVRESTAIARSRDPRRGS